MHTRLQDWSPASPAEVLIEGGTTVLIGTKRLAGLTTAVRAHLAILLISSHLISSHLLIFSQCNGAQAQHAEAAQAHTAAPATPASKPAQGAPRAFRSSRRAASTLAWARTNPAGRSRPGFNWDVPRTSRVCCRRRRGPRRRCACRSIRLRRSIVSLCWQRYLGWDLCHCRRLRGITLDCLMQRYRNKDCGWASGTRIPKNAVFLIYTAYMIIIPYSQSSTRGTQE